MTEKDLLPVSQSNAEHVLLSLNRATLVIICQVAKIPRQEKEMGTPINLL